MAYYERNLPHWHPEGKALFVTWRLWGSLPASLLSAGGIRLRRGRSVDAKARGLDSPRHPPRAVSAGKRFVAMDRLLDAARRGPKWLADDRVASVVATTLLTGERELARYRLQAFVIMPNHVHILIEPRRDTVKGIGGIKGASARAANAILKRTGQPFWQCESWDHWVRNAAEFERIRAYIERNPVTAGLASEPEAWRWSSAHDSPGIRAIRPV